MNLIVESNTEFSLAVDYTKTLEQAIVEGNYDWENDDINDKSFPFFSKMSGQKSEVSAKLFHFNCYISSEKAISEMDKDGYRPATLIELLALGFLFPELQRHFVIVALGSIWRFNDSHCYVTDLRVNNHKRGLHINWFDGGWYDHYRFLGVRK